MGTRIVILGGGFAGVYTARHLEHYLRHSRDVEITLVSRNNYFLMTPLLFEAGSGVLEPRHSVNPIRSLLDRTHFVEAEVERIDLNARIVHTKLVMREDFPISYDHLVLALGGVTNTRIIKGAEHALTFKTLADAIALRNKTIQLFEQADVERDPERKKALLTFVIIGGGFVGVELTGELSSMTERLARVYPGIEEREIRIELIEGGPRIAAEFDEELASYAAEVLKKRGVNIHTGMRVGSVEPGKVHLPGGETIAAETVIISTGVTPAPVVKVLPVQKDKRGAIIVEPTMRSKDRPELWALGDCASIPSPSGKPYPPLAQHALREAKVLAYNISAALHGKQLKPFVYETVGSLAALGHYRGVGKVYGIKLKGFIAWWVWRSYYLMRMPQWRRRIRVMVDWTVALFFGGDIVQLDLSREDGGPAEPSRDDPAPSSEAVHSPVHSS
ncbi:MAG TPA: NAD(P)/FAD-dependent oxidoreductase [Tepidisphaeraceae bacterium]|jgi:NADH dehydrogenase